MNPFDPFDLPALHRLDERALELHRHLLVENAEAGREPVIDVMCERALPVIVEEVTRLAVDKRLAREQTMRAVEETATTLQMRLRCAERLAPVTELAKALAAEAVDARTPKSTKPPRLAPRRPDLRRVESPREQAPAGAELNEQLGRALRRNQIKRNNPENS